MSTIVLLYMGNQGENFRWDRWKPIFIYSRSDQRRCVSRILL